MKAHELLLIIYQRGQYQERRSITKHKGLPKAPPFTRNRNINFSHLIAKFHYKISLLFFCVFDFLNIIEATMKL